MLGVIQSIGVPDKHIQNPGALLAGLGGQEALKGVQDGLVFWSVTTLCIKDSKIRGCM